MTVAPRQAPSAEAIAAVAELPLLHKVVVHLIALDPERPSSFNEVHRLALADPILAVHVLHLANSASSAPLTDLDSMRIAVARLGSKRLTQLAMMASTRRRAAPPTDAQRELWRHSVSVAVATQLMVEIHPIVGIGTASAYTSGLLHDIGRFAMLDDAPNEVHRVDAMGWDEPDGLVAAEHRVFGYDHTELGDLVCEHWALPDRLRHVVIGHHQPLRADWATHAMPLTKLVATVQIADRFATLLAHTEGWDDLDHRERAALAASHCFDPRWLEAPITSERLADLSQRVNSETAASMRLIGLSSD
jgi:HD-like signal output (HDOD) protein